MNIPKHVKRRFATKEFTVLHPESPGMWMKVTRTWWQRIFRDPQFASISELHAHYNRNR